MNESNPTNPEAESNSEDWKSEPPERFLAIVLHELRTPLMVIKGYVKVLSNEKAGDHPEALESISSAVGKIEELWDDMAEYVGKLMRKS